jgi:integrase
VAKIPKVTLLVRRKVNGRWKHVQPEMAANGRVKTLPGDGSFTLRHKLKGEDKWEPIDGGLDAAMAAKKRREIGLQAAAVGMVIPAEPVANRRTIDVAIEEYTAEILAQKDFATYRAYNRAVRQFRESCQKKTYLDEITRTDLLEFITFLRKLKSRRGTLLSDRTIRNRFVYVLFFLNVNGIKRLIKKKDWPQYTERTPEAYSEDQLQLLLSHANTEESLVINLFLCSAFRHGELIHAYYTDFDYAGSKVRVTEKPEWDWHPKKYQERTVPLPRWLSQQIAERRVYHPNDKLVFPNGAGRPDGHILRVVKSVAERAGLAGRVDDHKFRATAATRWSKVFSPQEVQYLLGHKDIQTTMRYLAIGNMDSAENRRKVELTFAAFAPEPPIKPKRKAKILEMAVA